MTWDVTGKQGKPEKVPDFHCYVECSPVDRVILLRCEMKLKFNQVSECYHVT